MSLMRFDSNGEKVTAKAHGGPIDIQGVTVAHLSGNCQITKLETWFDPLEMFRQIAPEGIVKKEIAAAAAAAGCPVMGHKNAADDATPADDGLKNLEQPTPQTETPMFDSALKVNDEMALDAAREADKAIVDGQARLKAETTASEVNPLNGEIPRANAE
jgi:hypothetical protein